MCIAETLVRERRVVVDAGRAGAEERRGGGVEEIAGLDHEGSDDAVEFTGLVALRDVGAGVAVFAGAELAEVL